MKYILLITIITVSCANKGLKEKALPFEKFTELQSLYTEKLAKTKVNFDKETGWPSKDDCDGLLWAGLAKAAGAVQVNVDLAEHEPGILHRRPPPACWDNGDKGSKSTVSRDMVLGYMWAKWRDQEYAGLKRFQDRTENRNWVLGEPWPERAGELLLTGNLIGLLGRMSCEMWENCPIYRKIEPVHSKSDTSYIQHLTVLFILLNSEVWGGKSPSYDPLVTLSFPIEVGKKESEKKLLEWHHEKNKNDALFSAAWHLYEDGDFRHPVDLLLSDGYTYPDYVRGSDNFRDVYWLFTARLILRKYPSP